MRRRPGLDNRPTQTNRIVSLLRSRSPQWVPLPEILNLRISQYNARLYQALHELGLNIESRVEIVNGKKHSWFRLLEASTSPAQISLPLVGSVARPTRAEAEERYL